MSKVFLDIPCLIAYSLKDTTQLLKSSANEFVKLFDTKSRKIFLVNLNAKRDWGYAEDYVKSIMPSITLIEGNRGSGVFSFRNSQVINGQTINVFCHIPDSVNSSTPILFVFHGGGRNASDYRNAFVEDADEKGFIVIAPEFSSSLFPGGDGYNLVNVFVDGDNPTSSSLNHESEWLFSVIEPLYDFVKLRLDYLNHNHQLDQHNKNLMN